MKVKYVKGDLIQMAQEGHFDLIAHGCNCFHTMGSGIAPKINALTGGRALRADKQTPIGDINKMGLVTFVNPVPGEFDFYVANLYTQFVMGGQFDTMGSEPKLIHWDSFYESMRLILFGTMIKRVGIPLIGCGLAGGTREEFELVVDQLELLDIPDDVELTIVEFE